MIELYKESLQSQFLATLKMFAHGIESLDDRRWRAPVVNMSLNQVAFHTLFFTDLYLSENIEAAQSQDFHSANADVFAGYEELADDSQRGDYERKFIESYLAFLEQKVTRVLDAETVESLQAPSEFEWLEMPRAEIHLYNVRHIQYHAGQLGLLVRQENEAGLPWVKRG